MAPIHRWHGGVALFTAGADRPTEELTDLALALPASICRMLETITEYKPTTTDPWRFRALLRPGTPEIRLGTVRATIEMAVEALELGGAKVEAVIAEPRPPAEGDFSEHQGAIS